MGRSRVITRGVHDQIGHPGKPLGHFVPCRSQLPVVDVGTKCGRLVYSDPAAAISALKDGLPTSLPALPRKRNDLELGTASHGAPAVAGSDLNSEPGARGAQGASPRPKPSARRPRLLDEGDAAWWDRAHLELGPAKLAKNATRTVSHIKGYDANRPVRANYPKLLAIPPPGHHTEAYAGNRVARLSGVPTSETAPVISGFLRLLTPPGTFGRTQRLSIQKDPATGSIARLPRLNPNAIAEWDAKQDCLLAEFVHEYSGDWSAISSAFNAVTPAHISRSAGKLSVHWRRLQADPHSDAFGTTPAGPKHGANNDDEDGEGADDPGHPEWTPYTGMLTPPPSAALDGLNGADVITAALQLPGTLTPSPSAALDRNAGGVGWKQRPERTPEWQPDPWYPDDVAGMENRLGEATPARLVDKAWRSGAKISAFNPGRTVMSLFPNLLAQSVVPIPVIARTTYTDERYPGRPPTPTNSAQRYPTLLGAPPLSAPIAACQVGPPKKLAYSIEHDPKQTRGHRDWRAFPVISDALAATVGQPPAHPVTHYYDVRATKGQQERHTFPAISKAIVNPRSGTQATLASAAHVRKLQRSYNPRTTVGERERRELFPGISAALATRNDGPPALTSAVLALMDSYDSMRSTGDTDRQAFPEISDALTALDSCQLPITPEAMEQRRSLSHVTASTLAVERQRFPGITAALATRNAFPSPPTSHVLELRRSYDSNASVADQEQRTFPGIFSALLAISVDGPHQPLNTPPKPTAASVSSTTGPVTSAAAVVPEASADDADLAMDGSRALFDGTSMLPCGTILDADGNVIGALDLEAANWPGVEMEQTLAASREAMANDVTGTDAEGGCKVE